MKTWSRKLFRRHPARVHETIRSRDVAHSLDGAVVYRKDLCNSRQYYDENQTYLRQREEGLGSVVNGGVLSSQKSLYLPLTIKQYLLRSLLSADDNVLRAIIALAHPNYINTISSHTS